ncbi:polysaccharide biosynthesis tyrosine autokinase [Pseudonocardia oroxyli]|nr:polysaccharide biosynthesis tyrosine autokinase [Pseudonocardia oroxyli]
MTVTQYIKALLERWRTMLTCMVVALASGFTISVLQTPQFTARTTLYVSAQTADTTTTAFQGAQLSQERVTSYVQLARSTRVAGEVVSDLRLQYTDVELATRISASSQPDSVLIDLSVTDAAPDRAAQIADSAAASLVALVDQLERPIAADAVPAVALRIVQPAEVPSNPSSPSLLDILTLAALTGLIGGIVAALIRNSLDQSIKSVDDLRAVTDLPCLGVTPYNAGNSQRPLIVHDDPQAPAAEAIKQLRTNLQFVNVDHRIQIVAITSALPGEGKSTTAVNLAIALAATGRRVALIEADLRRPTMAKLLGLPSTVGLTTVLAARTSLGSAIQTGIGGVDVLASGQLPPNPSELLASQQFENILADLRQRYDHIILDCAPLLPVSDAAAASTHADGVLMICRFKSTSRQQVASACESVRAVNAHIIGTVLSMAVIKRGSGSYGSYRYTYRPLESRQHEATQTAQDR